MTNQTPEIPATDHSSDDSFVQDFRRLVAEDLRDLAMIQDRELTSELIQGMCEVDFPHNLGFCLDGQQGADVYQLMHEAVQELREPNTETLDELAADFASIYLTFAYQASPCESPWLDEDGLVYQGPMFEVRDIYRHYGLQSNDWRRRSEDHIVLQMLFVAHLMDLEGETVLRDAANFLDEHALRWIGKFAERVRARSFTKFYAALAIFVDVYLNQLRDQLAEILGQPRPKLQEVAERIAARNPQQDENNSSPCAALCTPREEPKPGRKRYP